MMNDTSLEHSSASVDDLQTTNDKDLTELSGYHAYKVKNFNETDIIKVNGKDFEIIDIELNTNSGLEALTVENIETGEYTIVYVGSQDFVKDWVLTNPMLLGDTPPQQIEDAVEY